MNPVQFYAFAFPSPPLPFLPPPLPAPLNFLRFEQCFKFLETRYFSAGLRRFQVRDEDSSLSRGLSTSSSGPFFFPLGRRTQGRSQRFVSPEHLQHVIDMCSTALFAQGAFQTDSFRLYNRQNMQVVLGRYFLE